MKIIAQTDRLYLREFIPDDAIHLYKMNTDKDVIKHTGDTAFQSIQEAKTLIENYNQYELHGMGRWAVCLKSDHSFLGWCGLKHHPKEKLVEVGYRFYKCNWNKGYATESSKSAIQYGFNILKLKDIYAHAHEDNIASHRVIEKCELVFLKHGIYDNMPAKLYKIENPFYHIKNIRASETYAVRHPILRANRPLSDCAFDEDNATSTIHLGLFFKDQLIGVASFMKNKNILFQDAIQYQLRGMAILEAYQKKGLGNLILNAGENQIKIKCSRLWFNAREIALPFYKSKGYKITGKPFNIKNIGIHSMMTKQLF